MLFNILFALLFPLPSFETFELDEILDVVLLNINPELDPVGFTK